jgi:hypothetical protein
VIGRKTDGQKDRRTESQMGEREKGNITTKIERQKNTKVDKIFEFVIAAIVMMTKENIEPLSLVIRNFRFRFRFRFKFRFRSITNYL